MKPLEKIAEKLIINGSLVEQPGLFYGKTGIAVFFFHYAQHTGNELFLDYAMDLIENTQKQTSNIFFTRYDIGLAGIGACFEYLLQNDFLDVDDDDFFDDFDIRICSAAMNEPYYNLNLKDGLTGMGQYFIYRLNGNFLKNIKLHEAVTYIADEIEQKISNNTVSENEQTDVYRFLCNLTKINNYTEKYSEALQKCKKWKNISDPIIQNTFPYMNDLQRLYTFQNCFNTDLTEEIANEWKKWEKTDNNSKIDMGLLSGWASDGLFHLTQQNNNVSWLNLL